MFTIESPETIHALIMRNVSSSRILTPQKWGIIGSTYALGPIIHRLIRKSLTFSDLLSTPGDYSPNWLARLIELDHTFSYDHFSPLILRRPLPQEQSECPGSPFRVWDGSRRALALSNRLIRQTLDFQPVPAILMID